MVPILTEEERRQNLDKALKARRERAEVKTKLSGGEMSVDDVFRLADDGNEAILRMPVESLIRSLPGYALSRAQKLMKRLRIAQSRRIRGLSKRQRNELLAVLGGNHEAQ